MRQVGVGEADHSDLERHRTRRTGRRVPAAEVSLRHQPLRVDGLVEGVERCAGRVVQSRANEGLARDRLAAPGGRDRRHTGFGQARRDARCDREECEDGERRRVLCEVLASLLRDRGVL